MHGLGRPGRSKHAYGNGFLTASPIEVQLHPALKLFPRIMPCRDFVPIAERRWPAHFVADADSALNQLLLLRNNHLPQQLSLNRQ